MFGVGIALPSFLAPPSADGGYGEGGGFVRHTDEQGTAIGLRVEDAIENRHTLSLRAKILVIDRGGSAPPLGACIFEVPHQFPLLGVDTDHWIALSAETPAQFADVGELHLA
jgi:hypothetical protein